MEAFYIMLNTKFALTRLFHTLSREGWQNVASAMPSIAREHCLTDKNWSIEGKDGSTDCPDSPRECEKYGLMAFFCFFILASAMTFAFPLQLNSIETNRVIYLIKSGNLPAALDLYNQFKIESGQHDLELVQHISFALLEQGYRNYDPEIQLLTIFGAGISGNDKAIYILEEGVKSAQPQFQIAAINFLAKFQNDEATELINSAMTSNFLPIRLEAVYNLAKNKSPKAPGQVEALMQKVPPEALPIFPQLLAMCGDRNSIKSLQKLLTHPSDVVRTESILAIAKYGRDDLLPELRRLSTHLNVAQQEACAVALGLFKDESSADRLRNLARSQTDTVRLAALQALYQLGREEVRYDIEKMAREENLFAISILGNIAGSEPALRELVKSKNINVRINASLSLLKLHDPECLRALPEILLKDRRDLAFTKHYSFGRGLFVWKAVPSARQNFSKNPVSLEISLHMREETLTKALELPETDFIKLSHVIFETHQSDLVPTLTHLLSNLQSHDAIELLKYHREKVGAPLIRNYCNLALFRMRESGNYGDELRSWVAAHHSHGLIQFRPMIPWELRNQEASRYQLTPEDASRLLVEAFESLVQMQDENAIDILLNAIRYGNDKNRYALAGLLMRAAH